MHDIRCKYSIYFCIIAKIAVYQTDRYISPIYAVVITFVFILIEFILSHFKITKAINVWFLLLW